MRVSDFLRIFPDLFCLKKVLLHFRFCHHVLFCLKPSEFHIDVSYESNRIFVENFFLRIFPVKRLPELTYDLCYLV